MKARVGYQLYSAREEAARNLRGVLLEVGEMGYDGVEFAGYHGHSAKDIAAMLSEAGLLAVSAHVSIPDSAAERFEAVATLAALGAKYVAVPYLDDEHRPGGASFAKTIADIYSFGELARRGGLQLLYHNHDFEFVSISGQAGLDFIYDSVPSDILKTQIDTCWVKYAGRDPAEYVRKYAGRCPVVHLKDFVGARGGERPYALLGDDGDRGGAVEFEFRPVGHGCQDFPPIVRAASECGAEWLIVEQDLSVGRPPLEAARMSRDYLRSIGV